MTDVASYGGIVCSMAFHASRHRNVRLFPDGIALSHRAVTSLYWASLSMLGLSFSIDAWQVQVAARMATMIQRPAPKLACDSGCQFGGLFVVISHNFAWVEKAVGP
jgi:hypothetical protein